MDEKIAFHKVLHHLIEKFVSTFDDYIEAKKVNKAKVYLEVFKRRFVVCHGIGAIARNVLTADKTADMPVPENVIEMKIGHLVESLLQQDLLECALSVENFPISSSLSSDDMHNILFACSANDTTSIPSPFMSQLPSLSFRSSEFPCSSLHSFSSYTSDMINNNFSSMSAEFERSMKQFEDDLSHIKSTVGTEFSTNFRTNDTVFKLSEKLSEDARRSSSKAVNALNAPAVEKSFGDWLLSTLSNNSKEGDVLGCQDIYSDFLSWETRMRQSIPCHLYSTELVGKEVTFNISEEDSPMFLTLHDASGALPEKDFIFDVLDLLIGIPSSSFFYDESKGKFLMKPFVRLSNLSHESISRFSEKFMECGTFFYKLKAFCSQSIPQRGMVLQGLKEGVHKILSVYMMYIVALKTKKPSMHLLKTDILENAQLLITLGKICRIYLNSNALADGFPKGLSLMSSISSSAWSCKNKENMIMIAVLLKHVYAPYFNFLNKWMAEGLCYDPYNEFQIIEDFKYLDRRDELYWKFTYTENEDDSSRLIPLEIQKYSHDILQCGKSMRLLKDCCSQLFSLEYLSCNPPPCISMVFSYHAISQKKEQCTSYIQEKRAAEKKYEELGGALSDDAFHVEKQKFVDEMMVINNVEKRWKMLLAQGYVKPDAELNGKKKDSLKRSCSLSSVTVGIEDIGFSGVTFGNVGLLFSCCCYKGETEPQNSAIADEDGKHCRPYSKRFSQQLNLVSYFHSVPYTPELVHRKYFKCSATDKVKVSAKRGNELQKPSQAAKENGCSQISGCIPPGSFLDSLASLLISDYGDDKEDVRAFLELISLQKMLEYNFSPVLNMRMHLVQRTIMDYVVKQLKLKDLLLCLRNTYFLQDESFSQNLCERLFMRVLKSSNLHEFTDWVALNEILSRAVAVPSLSNVPFLESASVNFVALPETEVTERNLFLHYFQFEFKIEWPLNIIIHKACMTHYAGIFSLIIEMEFLCWLLGKLWRLFLTDIKSNCEDSSILENSPHYRKVMLHRFDMHQFIRVLHNCIHQDLGGPLWESLEKSLNTEELSIDDLEDIHCQYLGNALARCFLTEETSFLQDILRLLFLQVYKFCELALECSWELNPHSNFYETSDFEHLSSVYSLYKKCKDKFYDWIMQLVGRKKYGRSWDDHYPLFLETLLETGRSSS